MNERGFTLVELLVAIALFSVISVAFYSVMISGTDGSQTSRNVAETAEEARLGFNRIVRDTREADSIESASPTSYNVKIDFNADGVYENPNSLGDYEDVTFAYDAVNDVITVNDEVLMRGVLPPEGGEPMFEFGSNLLQYDWDADGITTWQELDRARDFGVVGVGNADGELNEGELPYITDISMNLNVRVGSSEETFTSLVQMRNRR